MRRKNAPNPYMSITVLQTSIVFTKTLVLYGGVRNRCLSNYSSSSPFLVKADLTREMISGERSMTETSFSTVSPAFGLSTVSSSTLPSFETTKKPTAETLMPVPPPPAKLADLSSEGFGSLPPSLSRY